jgi:hypothetical protein
MKIFALSMAALSFAAISSADLRSEIKEMDAVVGNAMIKGDMKMLSKAIKAGVTNDFTYVEQGRSMTCDQMLETMKAGLSQMKTTSARTQIVSLKEKGNSAMAVEKHMMAGMMTGPDKKTHKMSYVGTSTETYVKVGKEWKMSKMVWGMDKMMLDGKPMNPGKMAAGK